MLRSFRTPLACWGFAVLTVLGLAIGEVNAAIITGAFAAYAWKGRR